MSVVPVKSSLQNYSLIVSPLLDLPREIRNIILNYLPVIALRQLSETNSLLYSEVQSKLIQRAQEYHFKGEEAHAANTYLIKLFYEIDTLVRKALVLDTYTVFNPPHWLDAEATLRRLLFAPLTQKKKLITHFNSITKKLTLRTEEISQLYVLIILGVTPPNYKPPALLPGNAQRGYTPLHHAALEGDVGKIQLLCSFKANTLICDPQGNTPLHLGLRWGKEVVALLLKHNSNPNASNHAHLTPLFVNTHDHEVTELLCQSGANVHYQLPNSLGTPLHAATKRGHLLAVKVLLKYGANPNAKSREGNTPLYLAKENVKLITLLVNHGADVNSMNTTDHPLLQEHTNNPELLTLLCQKGAEVDHQRSSDHSTALHLTAEKGQLVSLQILLKFKANPTLQDKNGNTPLHLIQWNQELMALLLAGGANPNIANYAGMTPLLLNISSPEIVELLCQKGADVNLQTTPDQESALHLAVRYRLLDTIKILLKYGAGKESKNSQGQTPLELAGKDAKILSLFEPKKESKRKSGERDSSTSKRSKK